MQDRDLEFWDYDEWKTIIRDWPEAVRRGFGARLRVVQKGGQPDSMAKPLHGFAISVWEIWHRDGQRVIYTTAYASFNSRIYVLDAFEKDSRDGKKMRKSDKARIERRIARIQIEIEQLKAEAKARGRGFH